MIKCFEKPSGKDAFGIRDENIPGRINRNRFSFDAKQFHKKKGITKEEKNNT